MNRPPEIYKDPTKGAHIVDTVNGTIHPAFRTPNPPLSNPARRKKLIQRTKVVSKRIVRILALFLTDVIVPISVAVARGVFEVGLSAAEKSRRAERRKRWMGAPKRGLGRVFKDKKGESRLGKAGRAALRGTRDLFLGVVYIGRGKGEHRKREKLRVLLKTRIKNGWHRLRGMRREAEGGVKEKEKRSLLDRIAGRGGSERGRVNKVDRYKGTSKGKGKETATNDMSENRGKGDLLDRLGGRGRSDRRRDQKAARRGDTLDKLGGRGNSDRRRDQKADRGGDSRLDKIGGRGQSERRKKKKEVRQEGWTKNSSKGEGKERYHSDSENESRGSIKKRSLWSFIGGRRKGERSSRGSYDFEDKQRKVNKRKSWWPWWPWSASRQKVEKQKRDHDQSEDHNQTLTKTPRNNRFWSSVRGRGKEEKETRDNDSSKRKERNPPKKRPLFSWIKGGQSSRESLKKRDRFNSRNDESTRQSAERGRETQGKANSEKRIKTIKGVFISLFSWRKTKHRESQQTTRSYSDETNRKPKKTGRLKRFWGRLTGQGTKKNGKLREPGTAKSTTGTMHERKRVKLKRRLRRVKKKDNNQDDSSSGYTSESDSNNRNQKPPPVLCSKFSDSEDESSKKPYNIRRFLGTFRRNKKKTPSPSLRSKFPKSRVLGGWGRGYSPSRPEKTKKPIRFLRFFHRPHKASNFLNFTKATTRLRLKLTNIFRKPSQPDVESEECHEEYHYTGSSGYSSRRPGDDDLVLDSHRDPTTEVYYEDLSDSQYNPEASSNSSPPSNWLNARPTTNTTHITPEQEIHIPPPPTPIIDLFQPQPTKPYWQDNPLYNYEPQEPTHPNRAPSQVSPASSFSNATFEDRTGIDLRQVPISSHSTSNPEEQSVRSHATNFDAIPPGEDSGGWDEEVPVVERRRVRFDDNVEMYG